MTGKDLKGRAGKVNTCAMNMVILVTDRDAHVFLLCMGVFAVRREVPVGDMGARISVSQEVYAAFW